MVRTRILQLALALAPAAHSAGLAQQPTRVLNEGRVESAVLGVSRYGYGQISTIGYNHLGLRGRDIGPRFTLASWMRGLVPMPFLFEVDAGPALTLAAGENVALVGYGGMSFVTILPVSPVGSLVGAHAGAELVLRMGRETVISVAVHQRWLGIAGGPTGHLSGRVVQFGLGRIRPRRG